MIHDAAELFPWATIECKGLTVAGLIDLRHTHERRAWGSVLTGTDEQLASAAVVLIGATMRSYCVADDMLAAFCGAEIRAGRTDDVMVYTNVYARSPLVERALIFRAGWLSALDRIARGNVR